MMNAHLQTTVDTLEDQFALEQHTFRDHLTLTFERELISEICTQLRDQFGFIVLTALTAVDYFGRKSPRFHVVYQLHNREQDARLFLRTPVPEDDPVTDSVVSIFPNANWYEREVWDLYGIRFAGHPDLRRIMLPKGWEGHPMRKDVPVKVEETRFTFNYKEIDLDKRYVEE